MDWLDSSHRLEFDNHLSLHQEIDAVAAIDADPLVGHGERFLSFDGHAPLEQLMDQACFVRGLQQTRTKGGVHLDGGPDDLSSVSSVVK